MSDAMSFIDEIEQYIGSGRATLPVFNPMAQQVQQELVKREPDTAVLERLLIRDQALASEILRLANSPCYRGLAEIKTVKAAIVRLGLQEVCRIALLAATKNQFHSRDRNLQQLVKRLWQHSAGCALAANWLARRCKYEDLIGQAFFAGLLHDIGKLAILMVVEQIKLHQKKGMTESLLQEMVDTLHTRQGYALMSAWNMPQQYCLVVRDHHETEIDARDSLLLVVRMADLVCHKLAIGLHGAGDLDLAATREAHLLDLSEIDLAELEIKLEDTRALWQ